MVPWTRALQQRYYFRGGVPPVQRRRVSQCCHTRKNARRPRSAGTRRRHLAPTRPNERNGRRDDRSSLRRRLSRTHARDTQRNTRAHARAYLRSNERAAAAADSICFCGSCFGVINSVVGACECASVRVRARVLVYFTVAESVCSRVCACKCVRVSVGERTYCARACECLCLCVCVCVCCAYDQPTPPPTVRRQCAAAAVLNRCPSPRGTAHLSFALRFYSGRFVRAAPARTRRTILCPPDRTAPQLNRRHIQRQYSPAPRNTFRGQAA